MRVFRTPRPCAPRVIALGTFDGVHCGHQALIAQGLALAEEQGAYLQVVSFDRHPLELLRPEVAPRLLTTPGEKLLRMHDLRVPEMMTLPFTREMANREPEEFLSLLHGMGPIRGIVVGWNYTFGRMGLGTPDTLRADAEKHGYPLRVLDPIRDEEGTAISSTEIRKRLEAGDVSGAASMLGGNYPLAGQVEEGKHMGHSLGFPTANLRISARKQLPAYGVYACAAYRIDDRPRAFGGAWAAVGDWGMVNIGAQPTLPSGKITVEVHLRGGAPEAYGWPLRLELLSFLRPEKKFDSPEALRIQLERDREEAWACCDLYAQMA